MIHVAGEEIRIVAVYTLGRTPTGPWHLASGGMPDIMWRETGARRGPPYKRRPYIGRHPRRPVGPMSLNIPDINLVR